jgi:tRNA nucleotidyltransferase (CCA-adding enzyme)
MELEKLKQRVVEEYYPEEEELESAHKVFEEVADFIEKEYGLESHFAGSAGRGTSRKGDKDIDVFVIFPEDTSRKDLEEKGLEIGKKVFQEFSGEYHVEYAEHPYTKGELSGHEVEIVPCYDTDPDKIRSAVDRSPHHTEWVKENLDVQQRKDVVVLKAFLDAQGLYGSSLKIRGFSGYLCELLIAYYGSFEELIRSAKQWPKEQRIDFNSSESRFDSNFAVLDPVDSERNVAAVLSEENYAEFIFQAWKLDKQPSMEFFETEEEFNEFELKQELNRRADIMVLQFSRPEKVDDILYPQLRKLERLLLDKMGSRDFRVYESGVHAGEKCRIFFEMDRHLPEIRIVKGPQVFHNEEHLEQFSSKYQNVFVKDQRLCAKIDREFTDAQKFVQDFLDGEASELRDRGVPVDISSEIVEHSFTDALSGDEKWLKYLYRKFNCESK